MARVKRGTTANKRRKQVLKQTKGFRWGRKSKYRLAVDALRHAQQYAYRDRRTKKRVFRQDWQRTLGGVLREQGHNYSTFMNKLKTKKIELNRKVLSELAKEKPETFQKIVDAITKS